MTKHRRLLRVPRVLLAILLIGWLLVSAVGPNAHAETPTDSTSATSMPADTCPTCDQPSASPSSSTPSTPTNDLSPTCPVAQAPVATPGTPSETPSTTVDNAATNWMWALGGVMVVLAVFAGWRFLMSAKR